MNNLKQAKQSDLYLFLFILASTLMHSLSLYLFQMHISSQPQDKAQAVSHPIEFVTISPEESSEKPTLETQKRSLENSVAKSSLQPQKTAASKIVGDRPSSKLIAQPFPPIRILKPQLDSPQPSPPTPKPPIPKPPIPIPKPGTNNSQPSPPTPKPPMPRPPIPIPIPFSKTTTVKKVDSPQPKIKPVPSTPLSMESIASSQPVPPPPPIASHLPPETKPSNLNTASLLGGDYKRSLNDGMGDNFLDPEASTQQTALNPGLTNALKDKNLSEYFAEIKRRVKRNWNPSQAVEEYTTELTFDIEKNGQITGLKVIKSSGSSTVDRESVAAVQNSAFPLYHRLMRQKP